MTTTKEILNAVGVNNEIRKYKILFNEAQKSKISKQDLKILLKKLTYSIETAPIPESPEQIINEIESYLKKNAENTKLPNYFENPTEVPENNYPQKPNLVEKDSNGNFLQHVITTWTNLEKKKEHDKNVKIKYLEDLISAIDCNGLNPEIFQRPKDQWKYNIKVNYLTSRGKKTSEIRVLMDYETLEKEYLIPYQKKKGIVINGKEINIKDAIERIKITKTPIQDRNELNLFCDKHKLKTQNQFFLNCTDITNEMITSRDSEIEGIADLFHYKLKEVVKKPLEHGSYTEAVRSAAIQLENEVHQIALSNGYQGETGSKMMGKVFSGENPYIKLHNDKNSEQGKNIQEGYKYLFMGVMQGIRNPKMHNNIQVQENEAYEKLVMISHLMKVLNSVK